MGPTFSEMVSKPLYRPAAVKSTSQTMIDIVLKPKDQQGMFQQALDVNTPGNADFKNFLTPSGIREKYGQPQSVTDAGRHTWPSII
ncbi:protease pro-enzyme activation domain-containing protein [Lentilactobacillus parafarraginis]|uniref:protease pro-enzyme activation domain-containing protein n=1 Tax=Lentilactobacillus parafarraginis TaxID=390842 RepID=UPI001CDA70C8|nr:protease pro-enzyme activation domain-containing protein [Lentilactobacillus parafarraginis]